MNRPDPSKIQSVEDGIEEYDENESISKFEEIERELKEITDQYIFIPEDVSLENLQSLSDLEKRKRMVTMQTFTSYFSSDTLRYEEQIINKIKIFGTPYDEVLYTEEDIRVSD